MKGLENTESAKKVLGSSPSRVTDIENQSFRADFRVFGAQDLHTIYRCSTTFSTVEKEKKNVSSRISSRAIKKE